MALSETVARIPDQGANGVPVSVIVQATLAAGTTGGTVTLTGPAGEIAGTATGGGTLRTFAPSAPLVPDTRHTATYSGGVDADGQPVPEISWSFTTAAEPVAGVSFYGDDAFLGGAYDDDVAYTLGARMSFAGIRAVTHVRWWVPPGGRLPTAAGVYRDRDHALVATGDLTGLVAPTGGGWIAIPLDAEVAPEPDTTYVPAVLVAARPRRYPAILEAFAGGPVTRHGITYESGVFAVAGTLTMPAEVFHFASYAVDVLADPGPVGPPVGEAGAPQAVAYGERVTLRGTARDDGTIVGWAWRQISGTPVTLAGTGPERTFTAPGTPGLLTFGLTATDNDGLTSVEDRVSVAVHENRTAAENLLPGTARGDWDVVGAGDPGLLGYPEPYSVNAGEAVWFRVHGPATSIDVYRLGFYGGQGGRLHATLANNPTDQPDPVTIPGSNGAVECTNWDATAVWDVPAGTVSGQFVAVVRGGGGAAHIPFVVRNDERRAAVVLKSADATWHAYNYFGGVGLQWNTGACLYGRGDTWGTETNRTYAVSWARPIVHRATRAQTALFNAEYPALRFLEEAGLDVQYIGCQDLDRSAECLRGRRVFISSGHDEYWSQAMRDHAIEARNAGVHLIFWSGNEAFWRTRWDAADPERRVMWCYKDTISGPSSGPHAVPGHAGGQPLDPATWTGTFRDPRRPGGAAGEWLLTGTEFRMNGVNDRDARVRAALFGASPFWRDTEVARGIDLRLVGVLGFEADEVRAADGRAALLAETVERLDGIRADDAGETYEGSGPMRWGIVLRRHPSTAVTVGFGTVQWAWALSAVHDRQTPVPSQAARQATLNLLADMGVPAATVPAGLTKPVPVTLSAYDVTALTPVP